MIVKVQINQGMCIIYDKSREKRFSGPAPADLVTKMGGRPKAFFFADATDDPPPDGCRFVGLVSLTGGDSHTMVPATVFAVGAEAPWEGW